MYADQGAAEIPELAERATAVSTTTERLAKLHPEINWGEITTVQELDSALAGGKINFLRFEDFFIGEELGEEKKDGLEPLMAIADQAGARYKRFDESFQFCDSRSAACYWQEYQRVRQVLLRVKDFRSELLIGQINGCSSVWELDSLIESASQEMVRILARNRLDYTRDDAVFERKFAGSIDYHAKEGDRWINKWGVMSHYRQQRAELAIAEINATASTAALAHLAGKLPEIQSYLDQFDHGEREEDGRVIPAKVISEYRYNSSCLEGRMTLADVVAAYQQRNVAHLNRMVVGVNTFGDLNELIQRAVDMPVDQPSSTLVAGSLPLSDHQFSQLQKRFGDVAEAYRVVGAKRTELAIKTVREAASLEQLQQVVAISCPVIARLIERMIDVSDRTGGANSDLMAEFFFGTRENVAHLADLVRTKRSELLIRAAESGNTEDIVSSDPELAEWYRDRSSFALEITWRVVDSLRLDLILPGRLGERYSDLVWKLITLQHRLELRYGDAFRHLQDQMGLSRLWWEKESDKRGNFLKRRH